MNKLKLKIIDRSFAHCSYSNNPLPPTSFSKYIDWDRNVTDNEDIVFADFNDDKMFGEKMVELIENDEKAFLIRKNAFAKTSKYKIENFLKEIFYES